MVEFFTSRNKHCLQ